MSHTDGDPNDHVRSMENENQSSLVRLIACGVFGAVAGLAFVFLMATAWGMR